MSSLTFTIDRDHERFTGLGDDARKIVKRRLRAIRKISNAKNLSEGIRTVRADLAGQRGGSFKQLYRLVSEYLKTGDWKVLVNKAVAGPRWYATSQALNLPDAFLDALAEEWSLRQRDKFRVVHQDMVARLERWRRGDQTSAIPGYEAPPPPVNGQSSPLPAGWSEDNLRIAARKRVSKFTRKLIQTGPKVAYLAEAPHILSTRVGTEVGQYYYFDDSWNDFKVVAFGQTVRLLSFHILDLASGCNVKRGYKPALVNERDMEERLKDREMIWLTTAHFQFHGYHPNGTTCLCEKATATVKPEVEAIWHDFGLPISVNRGPRGGGPGIDALFTGPAGGNPRWKAPLESWFNGFRNRTDHLLEFPGQTGSYSSGRPMPEGLPGLERDTRALIEAARAMGGERAELIRLGMLNFADAIFALERVTDLFNFRYDHELEGWRKCGNVLTEWRPHPSSNWLPAGELVSDKYSEPERAAFSALIAANKELKRERFLSPAEVWYPRADSLKKIPLAVAAMMMALIPPTSNEDECVVERGLLSVRCREIDQDEPVRYGLTRRDGLGMEEPLRTGEKFLVRVNGCDPSLAYLYHANGSFAGVSRYYGRESRAEIQSNHRQFVQKRQWLASQTQDARFLASKVTKADIERTKCNAVVLDRTKPVTMAEKESAKFVASEGADAAADILAPADPTPEEISADAASELLAAIGK